MVKLYQLIESLPIADDTIDNEVNGGFSWSVIFSTAIFHNWRLRDEQWLKFSLLVGLLGDDDDDDVKLSSCMEFFGEWTRMNSLFWKQTRKQQ